MKKSLPKAGKIAILADPLDNQRAGVHVFTRELIQALVEQGHGDRLLLVREKRDESLPVEQLIIPNTRLPIGFASLRLFFIVPFLLRHRGVVAVFEPAHFGPFNLPKRIKRLTMIHDLTPLLFPAYHRWHSQLLQRIFLPGILRRTDWILTNSQHTANDVTKVFPATRDKVSKLTLGVQPVFRKEHKRLIYKFLKTKKPYFIYVGTIEPRKNLMLLLTAFKTFCLSSKAPVQLVLVGQMGWKTDEFEQALKEHPFAERIHTPGYVPLDDLPALYTQSIGLIYPSRYEGFGFPVVEAMACGTLVIAAKNSSLAEIGEGGAIFFRTDDPSDLVAKMEQVLIGDDLPSEEQLQAHARKFTWQKTATEFWQKVEELTAG